MANTTLMPHVELIGDPLENFYQLGLKDREMGKNVIKMTSKLIGTSNVKINNLITPLIAQLVGEIFQRRSKIIDYITAYSEGIETPVNELLYSMLLPEFVSCMDKWIPCPSLGCSSLFAYLDEGMTHTRFLDFPLVGTFDNAERTISYKLKGFPQIWSVGSQGLPFPSLTSMSEGGFTVGVHQKYSPTFNKKGTPVIELVFGILKNCENLEDVKEYILKNQTLTIWGLFFSDKNGNVLVADTNGENSIFKEHKLALGEFLYFNNEMLCSKFDQKQHRPFNFDNYNKMRHSIIEKKLTNIFKKGIPTDSKLLQVVSNPKETNFRSPSQYKLDPASPHSLHITLMNPGQEKALLVPGPAPKYSNKLHQAYTEIFTKVKFDLIKAPAPYTSDSFQAGNRYLMLAQTSIDERNIQMAYHNIQMAEGLLDGTNHGSIAKFYSFLIQYLYEPDKKSYARIIREFDELENLLPPHLLDHLYIIRSRLKNALGLANNEKPIFFNKIHEKRFYREKKIPKQLIIGLTRFGTTPRIEIQDVIYIP